MALKLHTSLPLPGQNLSAWLSPATKLPRKCLFARQAVSCGAGSHLWHTQVSWEDREERELGTSTDPRKSTQCKIYTQLDTIPCAMQQTFPLWKHWGWTFNNGSRREDTRGVYSVGQFWQFHLGENHFPWDKESVLGWGLVRREEKPTQERRRGRIYSGQVHRQRLLPAFQVNSLIQFLHLNETLSGSVVGKIS